MKRNKPFRPYYDLARLIDIHRAIKAYQVLNQGNPSMQDIVEKRLASSAGMVKYYYDHMEELGMIERDPKIARSIRLLPLEKAHPLIVEFLKQLEKEKQNASQT